MEACAIIKYSNNILLKVYEYDCHDYEILVVGDVRYKKLFASRYSGIDRAIDSAETYNGLSCGEVIFKNK